MIIIHATSVTSKLERQKVNCNNYLLFLINIVGMIRIINKL